MLDSKSFKLIDINIAPKTNFPVLKFDGKHLSYGTGSFDLVFFTYVLHHAADNAITLLEDAHRIARRHVIVLEDPKETEDDYRWAYKHDRSGTFAVALEWLKLFDLLKYDVIHEAALGSQIPFETPLRPNPPQNGDRGSVGGQRTGQFSARLDHRNVAESRRVVAYPRDAPRRRQHNAIRIVRARRTQ